MHLTDARRARGARPRDPAETGHSPGAARRRRAREVRRLAAALPFILPSLAGVTLFLLWSWKRSIFHGRVKSTKVRSASLPT